MAINDLGYREWNLDPTRERQQWLSLIHISEPTRRS